MVLVGVLNPPGNLSNHFISHHRTQQQPEMGDFQCKVPQSNLDPAPAPHEPPACVTRRYITASGVQLRPAPLTQSTCSSASSPDHPSIPPRLHYTSSHPRLSPYTQPSLTSPNSARTSSHSPKTQEACLRTTNPACSLCRSPSATGRPGLWTNQHDSFHRRRQNTTTSAMLQAICHSYATKVPPPIHDPTQKNTSTAGDTPVSFNTAAPICPAADGNAPVPIPLQRTLRCSARERPKPCQRTQGLNPNMMLYALPLQAVRDHKSYIPLPDITPAPKPSHPATANTPSQPIHPPPFKSNAQSPGAKPPRQTSRPPAQRSELAPQGSSEWQAGRENIVTGSILGTILGLDQPNAAITLGLTHSSSKTHKAFSQAMPDAMSRYTHASQSDLDGNSLDRLRMEWGNSHEPNGIQALLQNWNSIPCLAAYSHLQMRVCERGRHMLDASSLDPAVLHGIDFSRLPLLGSSPDAEIQFHDRSASNADPDVISRRVAVEIKTPCPFYPVPRATPIKGQTWYLYRPNNASTSLYATYFAQCQAHMLVLGVRSCIYVSHGVAKANVFEVELDTVWCNLMLRQLQQVGDAYLSPGVFPPVNFGDAFIGREAFLQLTDALCKRCKLDMKLEGVKGKDDVWFLDAAPVV